MPLSEGQTAALRELRRLDGAGGAIDLVSVSEPEKPGTLTATVSIDTRFPATKGGISLRPREEIVVSIPVNFPWSKPSATVRHRRWADTNHVNWGRHLCLYLAPDVEWNPSDGMHGFMHRLVEFLRRAAIDDLDPVAAPLHPPAVLSSADAPTAVIWADTPTVGDEPWLGFAPIGKPSDRLIEVRKWIDRSDSGWAYVQGDVAPAFLSHRKIYYDFPERLGPLLRDLEEHGVAKSDFLLLLRVAALRNAPDAPLYVIIGSPTRGLRDVDERQHLAIWEIDPDRAESLRLTVPEEGDNEELRELRGALLAIMERWAEHTTVRWCAIDEARPEIINRRDADSPLAAFNDKTVTVLGCGAIGSHLAEHLIRVGARQLNLVDNRRVTTGNLIRQNYTHADLATWKADALRNRLIQIRPDLADNVVAINADIHTLIADHGGPIDSCDVLVDAAANASITKRLDHALAAMEDRPWLISLLLGHAGDTGLMTALNPDSTIGPVAALTQTKLACLAQPHLAEFADEFWPATPRTELFVPEPGCSSPTFTGANADVATLVGQLSRESALHIGQAASSAATVLSLGETKTAPRAHRIDLANPVILTDSISSYRVVILADAHAELQAWIRKANRVADGAETGGLLFGAIDNATRTVIITAAIGPPPDSEASPGGFVCGIRGVAEIAAQLDDHSRGSHRPVGMWHTHPNGNPNASPTDLAGMTFLTSQADQPLPQQLLLIAGDNPLGTTWNTYLFDRETKRWPRPRVQQPALPPRPPRRIGLALSGGGLRAAAYHLGCLRALHDRGLLEDVRVVSGVSGGSVVAALWAYSTGPFDEFDCRVTDLLERGLTRGIAAKALRIDRLAKTLATTVTAGVTSAPNAILGPGGPLRRWSSTTSALEDSLTDLLGDIAMASVARPNLDVVINACELRTGSAFRFGSRESGSWRHGRVKNNGTTVAQAVACSAAYPIVFPAADLLATFVDESGERERRVILTDGGVFDNLGTSCLMPNRSPDISTNVHEVDIVIACDAGRGLYDGRPRPYWFAGRMKRVFEATYRRAQTLERGRLFDDSNSSAGLDRFVVAMLGMADGKLPVPISDLVPRDRVIAVGTSFNRLKRHEITDVTTRGEQIMWALCAEYI